MKKERENIGFFRAILLFIIIPFVFICCLVAQSVIKNVEETNTVGYDLRIRYYQKLFQTDTFHAEDIKDSALTKDFDNDSLDNQTELSFGTSLFSQDTDQDGVSDLMEYNGGIKDYYKINSNVWQDAFKEQTGLSIEGNDIYVQVYKGHVFDTVSLIGKAFYADQSGKVAIGFSEEQLKPDSDQHVICFASYDLKKDTYTLEQRITYETGSGGFVTLEIKKGRVYALFFSEINEDGSLREGDLFRKRFKASAFLNETSAAVDFLTLELDTPVLDVERILICADNQKWDEAFPIFRSMIDQDYDVVIRMQSMHVARLLQLLQGVTIPDESGIERIVARQIYRFCARHIAFTYTNGMTYQSFFAQHCPKSKENMAEQILDTKEKCRRTTLCKNFSFVKNTYGFAGMSAENAEYMALSMAFRTARKFNAGESMNTDAELSRQLNLFGDPRENAAWKWGIPVAQNADSIKAFMQQGKTVKEELFLDGKRKKGDRMSTVTKVQDELKAGHVVLSVMRRGNRIACAVVYSYASDAADPNRFSMKVYDPLFIRGSMMLRNNAGDVKAYPVNQEIRLYRHAVRSYTEAENENELNETYKTYFRFEYGDDVHYCFGNTNFKNDVFKYSGGQIFFLQVNEDGTMRFL